MSDPSTDIDPEFADRCADAATSLRLLAELGAHPHAGGADDVALAEQLAERMLADPEALLAVALTLEQARSATAWMPSIGDRVEAVKPGTHDGECGVVVRFQASRLPYVVRWPDGCEVGYAAHEIRAVWA